jgi:hypothetical protein
MRRADEYIPLKKRRALEQQKHLALLGRASVEFPVAVAVQAKSPPSEHD